MFIWYIASYGIFYRAFWKTRSFDETFRQDIADRRAKALFDRRSILLDTQSSLVRRGRNGRCQTSTLGLENLLFGRCNFPIRCYHWIHDFFLGFQLKSRFCVFLLVNETMLTGVGGLEVRFLVERHSLLSLKGIESAFLRLKFAVWTLGMIQRIALFFGTAWLSKDFLPSDKLNCAILVLKPRMDG